MKRVLMILFLALSAACVEEPTETPDAGMFDDAGVDVKFKQAPECAQYLECFAHWAETEGAWLDNTNTYGPDGVCWKASEQTALCCQLVCADSTFTFREDLEGKGLPLGPCGEEVL